MCQKALFADPNAKTQRKGVTCPGSHRWPLRVGGQSGSNQHLWPLTPWDYPLCCLRGGGLLVLGPFSGALSRKCPPPPVVPLLHQEAQGDHTGCRRSCPKTSQIFSSSAATSPCTGRGHRMPRGAEVTNTNSGGAPDRGRPYCKRSRFARVAADAAPPPGVSLCRPHLIAIHVVRGSLSHARAFGPSPQPAFGHPGSI